MNKADFLRESLNYLKVLQEKAKEICTKEEIILIVDICIKIDKLTNIVRKKDDN